MSTTNEANTQQQHHVNFLTPRRKSGSQIVSLPSSSTDMLAGGAMPSSDNAAKLNAAVTPSPLAAATKQSWQNDDNNSDSSDSDSSSSSDEEDTASNKIDRQALTAELTSLGITNTSDLSDYELLRLRNIQRNEAKLKSLGLFHGITSKPKTNTNNNKVKQYKSERARKAAQTRLRNKELARQMVEKHAREEEERQRQTYGLDNNVSNVVDGGRVQPHRTVRTITNYTTKSSSSTPSKRRLQWENQLSSLKSFHEQYGTFQITSQHGKEYKSLQSWKLRQRKEYLQYKGGRKSVLDEEQVKLLEGLGDDWWVSSRGRGRRRFGVASTMALRRKRSSTSVGRQSKNLWAAYSDDEDYEEEEEILQKWQREDVDGNNDDDDDDDVIGSDDSYSVVSEESRRIEDDADVDQRNQKRTRAYASRSGKSNYYETGRNDDVEQEYYSESEESDDGLEEESLQSQYSSRGRRSYRDYDYDGSKRSMATGKKRRKRRGRRDYSPPKRKSRRRMVNSLEVVTPAEVAGGDWSSPPSLKRSRRSYDDGGDDYKSPRRSSRRRMSTYSLREEESIVSADEGSYPANSSRRRRKRYVHHRSSSRHDEGYEVVERPMEEVVIKDIDLQAERDKLMAEYGALYGHKCVILAKRDQLEKELRGMEFAQDLLAD